MSDNHSGSLLRRVRSLIRRIQLKVYIITHRSRREPFALYQDQKPKKKPRGTVLRLYSFTGAVAALTLLAMLFPLRPSYSPQENRNLTAFPAFSLAAVWDGSFFSGVTTWFADTFPLRDGFLAVENRVEQLYGFQTRRITGQVQQADDIPDAPDADSSFRDLAVLPPEEPSQTDTEQPVTEQSAEAETESVTQAPTEAVTDAPTEEETEAPTQPSVQDGQSAQAQDGGEDDLVIPELDDDAVVEQLSAVLSIDDAAYEYYNFVLDSADRYTGAINRAAEELDGVSRVFSIIVPNSMGICVPADVQEQVNTSDQKKAIDYMYSSYGDKVHAVAVYNALLKHSLEGEYLYFRTDHHWTALGAYRAYEQFCAAAGLKPTPLDYYTEHEYPGFLGTFYNSTKSSAMKEHPDTVFAYESPATNNIHITTKDISDWLYLIIGNVSNASAGNKYGTFIGGDNPLSYIENPEKDDGSAVMLIKESYGNAFAPFLVDNYQYTYIIDYRYVSQVDDRKLAQMCRNWGIDDVIFLNTISTTRASSLIEKLDSFVG